MTLTEQWKNGELPYGAYYVENRLGNIVIDCYLGIKQDDWVMYSNKEIIEVLAPVPSYEEWKAAYECQLMESENQQLKELLKECKANLIHKKQLLEKLDKLEKPTKELLSKIDNAIGEKE